MDVKSWNEYLQIAAFGKDHNIQDGLIKPAPEPNEKEQELLLGHFEKFIEYYGKLYESDEEKLSRFETFKANLKEIESLNEEANGLTEFGVTKFSDLTSEEFQSRHLPLVPDWIRTSASPNSIFKSPWDQSDLNDEESFYNNQDQMFEEGPYGETTPKPPTPPSPKPLPPGPPGPMVSIDWRTKGVKLPIEDQKDCGSCWSFGSVGVTQILHSVKEKKVVNLSEQQLVDCTQDVNFGCKGGYLGKSMAYIQKIGVVLESTYPYTAVNSTCRLPKRMGKTYKVKSFDAVRTEKAMLAALPTSPVAIILNSKTLQHYKTGILASSQNVCNRKVFTHGVIIVGHGFDKAVGTKPAQTYWIVKNSWGTNWGELGYARILSFRGICGVGTFGVKAAI